MSEIYRLSFEVVKQSALHLYCDTDPMFYKNVTQTVPNSQIPDEHWHVVSKETNDPWAQYSTLKKWAAADTDFVRNVRLERMVSEPRWELVEGRRAGERDSTSPDDDHCDICGGEWYLCGRHKPPVEHCENCERTRSARPDEGEQR